MYKYYSPINGVRGTAPSQPTQVMRMVEESDFETVGYRGASRVMTLIPYLREKRVCAVQISYLALNTDVDDAGRNDDLGRKLSKETQSWGLQEALLIN